MGNAAEMGEVTYGSYPSEKERDSALAKIIVARTTDPARIKEKALAYAEARGLQVVDKTAECASGARLDKVRAREGTLAFVARTAETEGAFARIDPPRRPGMPGITIVATRPMALLVAASGVSLTIPSCGAFTQAAFDSLL